MTITGLPYECFRAVSEQDSKFNENECLKKWENIVRSYEEQPKDVNQMKSFMKNIGINVQIDYTYATPQNLDFSYDMFDKNTMLDYNEWPPVVKPEYVQYTINTLNRYFGVVSLTKMEIFQVRYDENDKMVELIQQYSKSSFIDAFEPLKMFLNFWFSSSSRRQFRKYVFEPELPVQPHDFNLYVGLKIELEKITEQYIYDEE